MPFIYIDRRKAGKGKSSPNRQRLIKRIRGFIKNANPQSLGSGGVANVYGAGRIANNPVRIAANALEEPWFAYARGGDMMMVLPGNTEYDRGDHIPITTDEQTTRKGGPGDGGEDEFIVNVASNEFLDMFFEDCELPNLDDEKTTDKTEKRMVPAGFATQGTPAQLSVIRTYKQALGRRRALAAPYRKEKEELEAAMKTLYDELAEIGTAEQEDNLRVSTIMLELDAIEKRLMGLNQKIASVSGFDKIDLRFHKKEPQPLKQVDAVLAMVMDVSGSMGQEEKTIARRWFALLYAFIKRRYENTDLIFIAHTDEVFEMSEGDFFSTRINGGTCVSPALAKVNAIIMERYDYHHTNIYVSHASDGDNWESDSSAVANEMSGNADGLMHKLQHFSYVEVGMGGMSLFASSPKAKTSLWEEYDVVHDKMPDKISMAVIQQPDDCYPIFKKMFKKK